MIRCNVCVAAGAFVVETQKIDDLSWLMDGYFLDEAVSDADFLEWGAAALAGGFLFGFFDYVYCLGFWSGLALVPFGPARVTFCAF